MSESRDGSPPKPKWPRLFLLGALLPGCFVVLLSWQLLGPSPAIKLAPDTTFITSPLRDNGLPDYLAKLAEWRQADLPLEDNAAPLLWRALWPGELEAADHLPLAIALGFDDIPNQAASLRGVHHDSVVQALVALLREIDSAETAARDRPAVGPMGRKPVPTVGDDAVPPAEDTPSSISSDEAFRREDRANELITIAGRRPWTSERLPPLARWIADNQQPLDLLVEAGERRAYYSPHVGDRDEPLLYMLLPGVQGSRAVAHALPVRAMWHLGEGRRDAAWRDLRAVVRVARLVGRGAVYVENLVGMAIGRAAVPGTLALLDDRELTTEQARTVLNDLQSVPYWSVAANSLSTGERFFYLDSVVRLATTDAPMNLAQQLGVDGVQARVLMSTSVDWNEVLRQGNAWYDRFRAAGTLPDRASRQAALKQASREFQQTIDQAERNGAWAGGVLSRSGRSQLLSRMLLKVFLPAVDSMHEAEDQANTELDMLRVAAALAVYRTQHGVYPAALEALQPTIVAEIPPDRYSGQQPFVYRPDADGLGYQLYSVYRNGADDGGTDETGWIVDGEWVSRQATPGYDGATDLVIRVPLPPLAFPPVE